MTIAHAVYIIMIWVNTKWKLLWEPPICFCFSLLELLFEMSSHQGGSHYKTTSTQYVSRTIIHVVFTERVISAFPLILCFSLEFSFLWSFVFHSKNVFVPDWCHSALSLCKARVHIKYGTTFVRAVFTEIVSVFPSFVRRLSMPVSFRHSFSENVSEMERNWDCETSVVHKWCDIRTSRSGWYYVAFQNILYMAATLLVHYLLAWSCLRPRIRIDDSWQLS